MLTCAQCGREFPVITAKLKRARYCSVDCRNAARGEKVEQTCAQCGETFLIVASKVGRARYCSKRCKDAERSRHITYTCSVCHTVFSAKASQKRRYCSAECFYADRRAPVRPVEVEFHEVAAYERLVFSIANDLFAELHPDSMTIEDFEQEGRIGLLTAIAHKKETGDPRPLATFAYVHIRMAIFDAYRVQDHMIRLPESLFRNDANVSPEELARCKTLARHLSIEAYAERPAPVHLTARRHYSGTSSVEWDVLYREQIEEVCAALMRLPVLQCDMLVSHFGLLSEPVTMSHLARQADMPTVTVWRLVTRGLEQVRQRFLARGE